MCYISLKLNELEKLTDKLENKGSSPIGITILKANKLMFNLLAFFVFNLGINFGLFPLKKQNRPPPFPETAR